MSTLSFQIHPSFRPKQRPRIDRAHSRLYGIVAGMDVEATGHGVCCDVKSLEMIAELANAHADGVPGRFGHPGMSENATGRKVQLAYNWRVLRGTKPEDKRTYLVHDAQLMEAARTSPAFAHDPVEYILAMAEQYPKHFAESLVLRADQVWTTSDGQELPIWEEAEDSTGSSTDEDGYKYKRIRQRPENALTNVPVLRPTAVHFCDFVNEGAITHTGLYPLSSAAFPPDWGGLRGGIFASLFTEENAPNYLLDHLFATVDDLRQRFHISLEALQPKVERLLRLYLDARRVMEGVQQATQASVSQPVSFSRKENAMSTRRRRSSRLTGELRGHRAAAGGNGVPSGTGASRELSLEGGGESANDQEELSLETEAALENAGAILTQAEQMASTIVQSTAELSQAPMLATAAQVAHLQGQVDQHTDQLHELTHQLHKLSELLVKNMELTAALQRNIARANGETVITQRVPVLGATGWETTGQEGFHFQQPGAPSGPGGWAVTQTPVSTEQRRAQGQESFGRELPTGLDPDSAEARAIRNQQRRAQQTRQA